MPHRAVQPAQTLQGWNTLEKQPDSKARRQTFRLLYRPDLCRPAISCLYRLPDRQHGASGDRLLPVPEVAYPDSDLKDHNRHAPVFMALCKPVDLLSDVQAGCRQRQAGSCHPPSGWRRNHLSGRYLPVFRQDTGDSGKPEQCQPGT